MSDRENFFDEARRGDEENVARRVPHNAFPIFAARQILNI